MPEPTLSVPKELIEPVIAAHVAGAITAALGDKSRLIEQIIERSIMMKVGDDGSLSRYSSDNKTPWLEVMAQKMIRDQVRACLQEEIARQAPRIKELVAKELSKRNSLTIKALVEGMTKGIARIAESKLDYRISVNVDSVKVDDRDSAF